MGAMKFRDETIDGMQKNVKHAEQFLAKYLEAVWLNIEQASSVVTDCGGVPPPPDDSRHIDQVVCMLANCLSDVIAAVDSIERGFIRPPYTILRSAVETLALTICIGNNVRDFTRYKSGKLKGTKAITKAKRIEPGIGKLYGLGSVFVHEGFKQAGRAIARREDTAYLMIVPALNEHSAWYYMSILILAGRVANLVGVAGERIFYRHLEILRFSNLEGSTLLRDNSTSHELALKSIVDDYEKEIASRARQRSGDS